MNGIEYFNFEIKPWLYKGQHGGTEKVLHITAQVNGEKYQIEKVFEPWQPAWETELEYYTRLAIKGLQDKMREVNEKPAS